MTKMTFHSKYIKNILDTYYKHFYLKKIQIPQIRQLLHITGAKIAKKKGKKIYACL